jgi:hypothetical protein
VWLPLYYSYLVLPCLCLVLHVSLWSGVLVLSCDAPCLAPARDNDDRLKNQAEEHHHEMEEVLHRLQTSMEINRLLQAKVDKQEQAIERMSMYHRAKMWKREVRGVCVRAFVEWKTRTREKRKARRTVEERCQADAKIRMLKVLKGWHLYAAKQTYR